MPPHVREGAENIAAKMFPGDATKLKEVMDVLLRFHANQFRLDNGADPKDKEFAASGVYKTLSRINHSCAPSLQVEPARLYAARHGTDASVEESGGVLLASAVYDLAPGERLTYNYGPPDLVTSWDVARRRAFLKAELGFVCGCQRCVIEEAGGSYEAWRSANGPVVVPPAQPAASEAAEPECLEDMLEDWQLAELHKHMKAKAVAERLEEVEEVKAAVPLAEAVVEVAEVEKAAAEQSQQRGQPDPERDRVDETEAAAMSTYGGVAAAAALVLVVAAVAAAWRRR